jgi:hypothetical protein
LRITVLQKIVFNVPHSYIFVHHVAQPFHKSFVMVTRHFMTLFVRPELFFGSRSDFVMFEMREMLLSDFLTIYKKIVELTEGATWFLNIMLSELLL